MQRTGEADDAEPSEQRLRVLLLGTATTWLATLALTLAVATPAVEVALVALLLAAVVPVGINVGASRAHRRLSAESASLQARLDAMFEGEPVIRPLRVLEWSAAPGLDREGGASPPRHRTLAAQPTGR